MLSFLVVSKNRDVVELIHKALVSEGSVIGVPDGKKALAALRKKRQDIIFIDLSILMEGSSGDDSPENATKPFKVINPNAEIVIMADSEDPVMAVLALKLGVGNCLTYPISADEIRIVANRISTQVLRKSELEYLRDRFWRMEADGLVSTRCENVREVLRKACSVAPTRTTVLIVGETGCGKGVLAKFIHMQSNRDSAQFISVHCGAIPETLLESELFGHEKGSFTGAIRRKLGKFEIARGGTIFLDEIGTISPAAQIKLLQVLQDGTFSRVGGDDLMRSSARVIAATNSDLKLMQTEGHFRKDLFYRLNVFPITIPPLRERLEDIPLFVESFLKKLNLSNRGGITGLHPQVLDALKRYSWPGNIRELENLIERAYILEESKILSPKSFPGELFEIDTLPAAKVPAINDSLPLADARKKVIESFETAYLKKLLARNGGKIKKSADEAGITTRQLHKMLSKFKIHKEEFKK